MTMKDADIPAIIIIMDLMIISLFKENNDTSLLYGPPMKTDIGYYQTFFSAIIEFLVMHSFRLCERR